VAFNGYCIKSDSALLDTIDAPHAYIEYSILLPEDKDSFSTIRTSILDACFGMEDLDTLPDDSILLAFSNDYFRRYIEANIELYQGGHSFNWEMMGTSIVSMNRNGLLVYRVDNYGYTGGAHGMGVSRFLVFDTKKMERLHLKDIFIEGYEPRLSRLLDAEYRARYFLDDEEALSESGLFDDSIYPSENFYLTNNSVIFYYNPYELAPYAMGSITISLYHSDIRHLLKEDSAVLKLGW
jgi:hypothetical protein